MLVMFKKLFYLSMILSCIFFITACDLNSTDDDKNVIINGIEYFFWDYDENPYYIVYGVEDKNITEAYIEAYINEYPVRKIGQDMAGWTFGLFEDCDKLRNVFIPDTVEVIGKHAFEGCESLKYINLPETIKVIDSFAFQRCTSLKSISIPNSVQEISFSSFELCTDLEFIEMPLNLKSIEESAFENCSSLKEIELPSGVLKIEKRAFWGCDSLTKVVVPESTEIDNAFWGDVNIVKIP